MSPTALELDMIVEVGQFYYIVKSGKVNIAEIEAKRDEIVYIKKARYSH